LQGHGVEPQRRPQAPMAHANQRLREVSPIRGSAIEVRNRNKK
jgi:hypothetical protein